MKCFGTTRGGRACFGEIVCARVSGTRLLHGKFEVNWLELIWLGKTENTEEYLYGEEHGERKFWTIRRQPESARRGYVDKLAGDPFNPKPKTSMAVGRGELTCNGACEPARTPMPTRYEVTEKRWYVTEGSGQRARSNDGLPALLERNRHAQRRMPWTDRWNSAATKPYEAGRGSWAMRWPNDDEISAGGVGGADGTAVQHRGSTGSGAQR